MAMNYCIKQKGILLIRYSFYEVVSPGQRSQKLEGIMIDSHVEDGMDVISNLISLQGKPRRRRRDTYYPKVDIDSCLKLQV